MNTASHANPYTYSQPESLTHGKMMSALAWAYDKAVNGVPGLDSTEHLAESYTRGSGTISEQANSLIRWQCAKAGASGFVTGLGGLYSMPFAIPANIASVLFVQLRMVAAIAHIGGYDVRDDRVVTLAYACLLGNEIKDLLKDASIKIGSKLTVKVIEGISGETIRAINQKIGFRLITKFGEQGAFNLGKAIPFVGGVISGTLDAASTNAVGKAARRVFITV